MIPLRYAAGVFAVLGLLGTPLLAHAQQATQPDSAEHQDHHPEAAATPEPSQDSQMMGMHEKMMAEMKATDARLDALAAKMNAATGDAKVQALAELVTAMVQQQKDMHSRMMSMMPMMGMRGAMGPQMGGR